MSANPMFEQPRLAAKKGSPNERAGLLYERYSERVFGYCLYKLGNRQEAEDAAQTTFLWALRGLEEGIEPRLEANWLFTIAQNACRARIRTRGRRREQEVLSDPQILAEVAPGRGGAPDDLVGLADALRDMPELQRRAIILREWRGFSYKEIAAELELSDAAVETLIFRARRSLASRLENPNARPARRAQAFALNLGSLGSAFRSLFGAGGGAKLAAVGATVAALGVGLGVPGDSPAPPPRTIAPPADVRAHEPLGGIFLLAPRKAKAHAERTHASQPQPVDAAPHGSATPGDDGASAVASLPAIPGDAVRQATDAVAPAVEVVDSAVADVGDVVAGAESALEPLTAATPLP